jgi:hypothetical protein
MSNKEIFVIIWLVLIFNTILGMYDASRIKKMILEFDPKSAKGIGIRKIYYDQSPKVSFRFVSFIFKNEWKSYPSNTWRRFYLHRFIMITQILLMLVLMFMIFGLRVQ